MTTSMRWFAPFLFMCAIPCQVAAWEVDTHAWITLRTFERSNLNSTGPAGNVLTQRLGFDRYDPKATFRSPGLTSLMLGPSDKYFDLLPDWDQFQVDPSIPSQSNRFPNNWEYSRFPEGYRLGANPGTLGTTPQLRLEAWLMRGVVPEDDLDIGEYISPPIPDADPYGDKTRVFGHFYDPINNDGIPDVPFIINEQRVKAINWALGLTNALLPTYDPLLTRDNHFTWVDARRAYFKALTYQTANATFSGTADEFESEARLFFLATTAKALGQVVHILQDGSQPQHARIDRHNHSNMTWPFLNADLPRRLMEVYTNIRVTRDINLSPLEDREPLRAMFTVESGNLEIPAVPPVGSYPIPQFATPRRFFTTRDQAGGDDFNLRKGLVDYANRGFFTEGTANGRRNLKARVMPSPPPNLEGEQEVSVTDRGRSFIDIAWSAPEPANPTYVDAIDAVYSGKIPLGQVTLLSIMNESRPLKVTVRERHLRNHANALIPRAIAYSAGLINYFFRGTLEIEPIDQKIFAVVNQGEPHTIDVAGWPRKTTGGGVFGFDKVRLKVRNITDPITEPGVGGSPIPQTVAAGGQLYAIARYHRNPCYKANLSGERSQTFPTPPLLVGIITEPTCGALGPRTVFQDISVSAALAITSVEDLPGGAGAPLPNSVEKTFDFSTDPIPINATDLILQVVYRGTLGEEPESVALGTLDVREPTIVTFWENTDYFLDTTVPPWRASNSSYPARAIQYFRFCVGSSPTERLGYWFAPPLSGNAMSSYGSIRIALIVPKPSSPSDTFRVKGTPVASSGPNGVMAAMVRTSVGRIVQSNREFIATTTTSNPQADCNTVLPTTEEYWCNDPLQRRRQVMLGSRLQPMAWVSTSATAFNTPDVGEIMPVVGSTAVQALGEVRFNDTGALANCPAVPTEAESTTDKMLTNEVNEVARSKEASDAANHMKHR